MNKLIPVLLFVVPLSAWAGLIVEPVQDEAKSKVAEAAVQEQRVVYKSIAFRELGTPKGKFPKVKRGHAALNKAVEQFVPKGYDVKRGAAAESFEREVSWTDSANWVEALKKAASGIEELGVTVDHKEKIVSIMEREKVAPPVVPGAPQKWVVTRNASLKETLRAWSKLAGWDDPVFMLPENKDYTLKASMEHVGDFLSAVTALFESIPENIPITGEARVLNKVIIVTAIK